MELRHLRYFVAVAEEGGFVRAAERLHIAQPALSRQIRDLEREVGVRLIERDGPSGRLTAAGDAVLLAARAILGDTRRAIERARRSSRGLAGRCAICAGKFPTWNGTIARLVTIVRRDFPHVEVVVTEGVGRVQWRAVRSGKCDLGIGMKPSKEFADLGWQELTRLNFDAAVLPSGHPLVNRASVRLAELAADTIIAVLGFEDDHYLMCAAVAARATPPTAIRRVDSVPDAFAQIAAGNGWTPFVSALASWVPAGATVVSVEDLDVSAPLQVIWRRGELPAVVRTVRDTLLGLGNESSDDMRPDTTSQRPAIVPRERVTPDDPAPNVAVPLSLELRHLRYFLAVTAERSVGRAARSLAITQPTLSRQMHDLERMVGVPLLERKTKGAVPAAAGVGLAMIAREILDRADGVTAEAHRAARGAVGQCIIGTIPTAVVGRLIAALMNQVATELPDAQVAFTDTPTPQQPDALVFGQIDLGICHSFTSVTPFLPRLHRERLLDDPVRCALLSSQHPLAARAEIALSELEDLPFLFMSRALYPAFHDRVMMLFASHHFHPRIEQAYDGLQTTWSLAQRGDGWCIGFRSNLRFPPAGLVAVPVRELDLPWGIEMLYRRGEARRMVLRVMELIRRTAAAYASRWQTATVGVSRVGERVTPGGTGGPSSPAPR